jgi:hypothetical protein
MHPKFESLPEDRKFIALNNIVFNPTQIKNNIIQDFKPKKNDLSFCRKNLFLKKYFREINNQGIFNRIEWKFWLKEDIQCELITFDKIRKLDELQIKVILDFSSTLKGMNNIPDNLFSKDNKNTESFNLKVWLDFSIRESEVEETPTIDDIETIFFKNINEQNTAYSYSFSSEKICV